MGRWPVAFFLIHKFIVVAHQNEMRHGYVLIAMAHQNEVRHGYINIPVAHLILVRHGYVYTHGAQGHLRHGYFLTCGVAIRGAGPYATGKQNWCATGNPFPSSVLYYHWLSRTFFLLIKWTLRRLS